MALTQISTQGIKDGTITGTDLATNIDLVDNQKLRLGTGNDLQIFHQGGGDSFVDSNSGQLYVRSNNNIYIQPADNENGIVAIANGAVELYHDNSKKFETTSGGAKVTGFLNVTTGIHIPDGGNNDNSITIGSNNDLRLYHDGSSSRIIAANHDLIVQSDGYAIRSGNGSSTFATINSSGVTSILNATPPATGVSSLHVSNSGSATTLGTAATLRVSNNGGNSAYSVFEAESGSGSIRLANDGQFYVTGASTFNGDIRVDRGTAGIDGLLGQAYSGYFGLKHADQTINTEYMMISNNSHTFISCTAGYSIYLRPSANSSVHETIFAHDVTHYKTNILMDGHAFTRNQHQWGHLEGSYDNVGNNSSKSNPIYTIGSSYNPNENDLSNMYGIGFSHGNASFTPPNAGWGLYAAADGDARIYLDASNARIYLDSTLDSNNTDPMYLAPTTGNYGSIQINGGTTGGWLGYSIAAGAVFMYNGSIAGIFNDIENEWYAYGNRNGQWRTFYNGIQKTNTSDTGLTVIGLVNETSDIALKENIQPLTNALENLKKLKGYSYNFIDNKAKALGIVAQDVEKVYPDIVEGEEGEKSVAYSGLIAVLIEAVKELETEVAALKAG